MMSGSDSQAAPLEADGPEAVACPEPEIDAALAAAGLPFVAPKPEAEPGPDAPPELVVGPELFLNRELGWLAFGSRVLHEAEDPRNPLLERVKFLAISDSNLDEFVMKRIGGLKQQLGAGLRDRTPDGRTPAEQIAECHTALAALAERERGALATLLAELADLGIRITSYDSLEPTAQKRLRDLYYDNIFPLVTPQVSDPAHPFPFVSNLSLNLLVSLHPAKEDPPLLARIKVPVGSGTPRFIEVPGGAPGRSFVPLESIIAHNLDLLFPGASVESCGLFRVTRNANTERDEEDADDLLALIEAEMRDRKFAPIVRLEVSPGVSRLHRGMLAAEFGLDERVDVIEVDAMMALRHLWELVSLDGLELHDPVFAPVEHPALVNEDREIFHVIREAGALLVYHPYQSYATMVERFLRDASRDPKVLAIKMTLYRTDAASRAIDHLIEAAENGKQVAVVVELRARFDESANIRWASRLEESGIHVTYGVLGLKTHCKAILVVRRDFDGLRRYAHIGTGNYNAETARVYADIGLLSADPMIGQDLTELFNYLTTGYKPRRRYAKLLPAPKHCKSALLAKLEREIEHRRQGRESRIRFKTNALEDVDVCCALYRASRAGVPVELLVRDSCRLRPGLPGVSETMRVVSIVGRFLEHARVYHFHNGGDDEYYIGSTDCMSRNLETRVEILVPVQPPELQAELSRMLDLQLADRRCAWEMRSDGSYEQLRPRTPEEERGCQTAMIEFAADRHRRASRLRRRHARGPSGRQR
jgi:polyphosphate kinase